MIIQELQDLEKLTVVEPSSFIEQSSYSKWQVLAQRIYTQLLSDNPKFSARPYQPNYAALFALRKRNIMAYDMSAGKTITTALHIASLYPDIASGKNGRVHILVPNLLSARRWAEDLTAVQSLTNAFSIIKEPKDLQQVKPILIYTHDFLKRKVAAWKGRSRNDYAHYLAKYLRPSLVVIDEVHGFANAKTARAKAAKYLLTKSKRVLGVTGTLSDGRLEMVDSLCRFIYQKHWPFENHRQFVKQYGDRKQVEGNFREGAQGEGTRYLDHLDWEAAPRYYQTTRRFVHRVTLKDPDVANCIKLPKEEHARESVPMSQLQQEEYLAYIEDHRKLMESVAASTDGSYRMKALSLIQPLVQICNSPYTAGLKEQKTLEKVLERNKTLIFCQHVASARHLTQYLSEHLGSDKVVRLYAQDPSADPQRLDPDQRAQILEQFQYGSCRAGVFSVNLASESIDLTAADQVLFYCMPWSSLKVQQGIYRSVRPGNPNNSVRVQFLEYEGAIDQYQNYLVETKLNISKQLVDYEGLGEPVYSESVEVGDVNPIEALKYVLFGLTDG